MKDQLTTLKQQSREETLDALEAILYDPKVRQAVESLEPFVGSPPLVPTQDAPVRA